MDKQYTKVILANMCMVYNDDGEILVQLREKKDWPGLTFPGGHVEKGETLDEAMIREMKEETGLIVSNLEFCGIFEWPWEDDIRYLGLLYRTKCYEGKLKSSNEGKVFFINKNDINKYPWSTDFDKLYEMLSKNI